MLTLRKALVMPGLCLLPMPCVAQAAKAPPAPVPPALAATPPPSSNGVFPLSSVRAGLHGVAYTVFTGSVPEPFGVDILGVLHNAQGPGEDLILARLTGAKAEYTGVVAGMSGSPVYIDGKLVGALAFRIGEFSKEPIAGITPIAEMLKVRDLRPIPPGADKDSVDTQETVTNTQNQPPGVAPGVVPPIAPIDTPLVFSGFSQAALMLWKQHAPAGLGGMEPVAGVGGSQQGGSSAATGGPAAAPDSAPALEPGSAVSALLVSGDMEIAATCTVTYLDARNLLACGHPLTQFGAVSLPMTKADVVATLASPAGSFKIVNTGATVGAFTQDRQTAIGGQLGTEARMIPVTIEIHRPGEPTKLLHVNVLDQAQLTPTAILVSLFQALQQTPDYAEEDSYRLHAKVQVDGYAPVQINTMAAPGGFGTAALTAALTLGLDFNQLYSSSQRNSGFAGVQIDVDALPGRRAATLDRASVDEAEVHPGDRLMVQAIVHPYRGTSRTVRVPVTIPASMPPGDMRLLVSDGATVDSLVAIGRKTSASLNMAATVADLNSQHANDSLYVSLLKPETQLSVDGETLQSVPLSVANLLVPAHEAERTSLHSESAVVLATVPIDASFTGEQILTIRVE